MFLKGKKYLLKLQYNIDWCFWRYNFKTLISHAFYYYRLWTLFKDLLQLTTRNRKPSLHFILAILITRINIALHCFDICKNKNNHKSKECWLVKQTLVTWHMQTKPRGLKDDVIMSCCHYHRVCQVIPLFRYSLKIMW